MFHRLDCAFVCSTPLVEEVKKNPQNQNSSPVKHQIYNTTPGRRKEDDEENKKN